MARTIELIPLLCPKCSTPIPAEPDEAAWLCALCGQGVRLDEERGVAPIEVFFSSHLAQGISGKPFWVAEGRVALRRETFSGNKERDANQFWSEPKQFCVPAFQCDFGHMLSMGLAFLREPPALQPGPRVSFDPVILGPEDVRPLAELLVVAVEAERADKLKEVQFELDLSEPALWILP